MVVTTWFFLEDKKHVKLLTINDTKKQSLVAFLTQCMRARQMLGNREGKKYS